MDLKGVIVAGGGILILLVVVIIAISFDTVEPTEWGIAYNTWTKNVYKEYIYESGRYMIGFMYSFITFPRNYVNYEFSDRSHANSSPLKTRTKEGLGLVLHISFQYQLVPEKLVQLYEFSNINYEQTFSRIARDTILQEAGSYEAPQYWGNRTQIGLNMMNLLDEELQKAFARCKGLQILKIELPQSFEDSIVATQVEVQKTTMKGLEQQAERIRQQTNVLISEAAQKITVIDASASAQVYYLKQLAQATAKKNTLGIESWVYEQTRKVLNLTEDEFSDYIYLRSIQDNNEATLVVGIKDAIISVNPSN